MPSDLPEITFSSSCYRIYILETIQLNLLLPACLINAFNQVYRKLASSLSNQLLAWLCANLWESHLEQDIHKLFIPSDRQFNTLGVHNIPAFKAVAFVNGQKQWSKASIIVGRYNLLATR